MVLNCCTRAPIPFQAVSIVGIRTGLASAVKYRPASCWTLAPSRKLLRSIQPHFSPPPSDDGWQLKIRGAQAAGWDKKERKRILAFFSHIGDAHRL